MDLSERRRVRLGGWGLVWGVLGVGVEGDGDVVVGCVLSSLALVVDEEVGVRCEVVPMR